MLEQATKNIFSAEKHLKGLCRKEEAGSSPDLPSAPLSSPVVAENEAFIPNTPFEAHSCCGLERELGRTPPSLCIGSCLPANSTPTSHNYQHALEFKDSLSELVSSIGKHKISAPKSRKSLAPASHDCQHALEFKDSISELVSSSGKLKISAVKARKLSDKADPEAFPEHAHDSGMYLHLLYEKRISVAVQRENAASILGVNSSKPFMNCILMPV